MKKSLFALIATLALMAQPSSATETVPVYFEQAYTLIEDMLLHPWTTGCQTGGNYKDAWVDYMFFMQNVPTTFNGWYYLRPKR